MSMVHQQQRQLYPIKHKKPQRTQLCGVSGVLSASCVALIWLRALTMGHQAIHLLSNDELVQDSNAMDVYTRNLSVHHRKTRTRYGRPVASVASNEPTAKQSPHTTTLAAAVAVAKEQSTTATSAQTILVTSPPVTAAPVEPVKVMTPPPTVAPTIAPTRQPTPQPTPRPTPQPMASAVKAAAAAAAAAAVIVPSKVTPEAAATTRLPLVEFNDCRTLAPYHVQGDDMELKCATLYAQRFWKQAPQHLRDALQWQRDHRPLNCWYETELLSFARLDEPTQTPYPKAVCRGDAPEHVVYWHNFKAAGTTARHSLGVWGFPNYQPAQHIFSDELPNLVNATHTLPDGLSEPTAHVNFADFASYLEHVDVIKHEAYQRQLETNQTNMGFTFVRSPVQRFLSGLEQVERLNDTYWEVSPDAAPCMELTNSHEKVECVVDSLTQTRVFFNVHVYPQAYLFDTWTQQGAYDLAITVLDLKDMDALFKRFKGKKIVRVRESSVEGSRLDLQDTDLEPRLLVKICHLYEADLLLLRTMGMEDPLCAAALSSRPAASS